MRYLMLKNLKVYHKRADSRKDNYKFSRIKSPSRIKTNYLTRLMKK